MVSPALYPQSSLPRPTLIFLLILLSVLPSLALSTPISSFRVLPVEVISEDETTPRSTRIEIIDSPVTSASCGYARVSKVGVAVNKGATAVIKYKIKIKAISSTKLVFRDGPFVTSLTAVQRESYQALRSQYSGGLNIPMLDFLGVDLQNVKKVTKNPLLTDAEHKKLSGVALKIMKSVVKQKIVVKGKLKATGLHCTTTTAFAFVKIAKLSLLGGDQLTMVTDDGDAIAGTRNGDTVLSAPKGQKKKNRNRDFNLVNVDQYF